MPAEPRTPTKAYIVERITRAVTTALVYADSVDDAKRRYLGDEQTIEGVENVTILDTNNHEGRGWGKVRRDPESDREGEDRG